MNGQYTINSDLDKDIDPIINRITDWLVRYVHPRSIILSGSFGRGEATVVRENRELRFLSDCEINLISAKYVSRSKLRKLTLEIKEETGLQVDIYGTTLSIYLLVPAMHKMMKPTIQNYELKYGSRVLYGKNYLRRIPDFQPKDIPLWEGIRLLFNRMAEALNYFPVDNGLSHESVFWSNKILLACQDSLLLSMREYHHSYRTRNAMFQQLFPEYLDDLNGQVPKLLPLTIRATDQKLSGDVDCEDVAQLWFEAAEVCDKVFRHVIKKDMGFEFGDYLEFQQRYLESPRINHYYQSFIHFPPYQNFLSILRIILLRRGFISLRMIKRIKKPWTHIVDSIIPLVYFGAFENQERKESYLSSIREILGRFTGWKEQGKVSTEFNQIQQQVVRLWRGVI